MTTLSVYVPSLALTALTLHKVEQEVGGFGVAVGAGVVGVGVGVAAVVDVGVGVAQIQVFPVTVFVS